MSDWYVKNGGNDSNSGVDDTNAFATIGQAESVAVDGDRILLKRGSTFTERSIPSSGVNYIDYDSGNKPIIDANNVFINAVTITNRQRITYQNIEFNGATSWQIEITGTTSAINFFSCEINNSNSFGVKCGGSASDNVQDVILRDFDTTGITDTFIQCMQGAYQIQLHDSGLQNGANCKNVNNFDDSTFFAENCTFNDSDLMINEWANGATRGKDTFSNCNFIVDARWKNATILGSAYRDLLAIDCAFTTNNNGPLIDFSSAGSETCTIELYNWTVNASNFGGDDCINIDGGDVDLTVIDCRFIADLTISNTYFINYESAGLLKVNRCLCRLETTGGFVRHNGSFTFTVTACTIMDVATGILIASTPPSFLIENNTFINVDTGCDLNNRFGVFKNNVLYDCTANSANGGSTNTVNCSTDKASLGFGSDSSPQVNQTPLDQYGSITFGDSDFLEVLTTGDLDGSGASKSSAFKRAYNKIPFNPTPSRGSTEVLGTNIVGSFVRPWMRNTFIKTRAGQQIKR